MKTGDNIGFAVAGYLAVGAIIGLTQLGLNKLFEPPCSGIVKHALWERGHPEDTHFLWRAGSSVVQWLPDLYSRVLKGDMTVRLAREGQSSAGLARPAARPRLWSGKRRQRHQIRLRPQL